MDDGVRGSRGDLDSMHLTACISLNIQDIHTYDTPRNSCFPCLLMVLMCSNMMQYDAENVKERKCFK